MKRRLKIVGISTAVLILSCLTAAWLGLRLSLPAIDGTASLNGLGANILIQRDSAGVPTITAQNRTDLALGLGFVHAQDRFFEMDLMRRAAAGELSALLGPALIKADRDLRLHQFRRVARAALLRLDPAQRKLLDAYVAGVNAGLASLRSRPFEYWILRSQPRPWTAEDTVLCVHAMFLQLQEADGHPQLQRGLLRATLPESAYQFMESDAPEWDAAVDDTHAPEPRVPLAEEFNVRDAKDLPALPPVAVLTHLAVLGSNNWAVSGTHTANGSALVANDMHLGYRVPIIWYRARMIQSSGADSVDVTGVTLPGTPATVAGSNGSIAWGFTNSYGEFETVVRLVGVSGRQSQAAAYETAAGAHPIQYIDEPIEVAGAATEHLKIALTEWGPVVGQDWEGQPYALQWTAQDPLGINLNLLGLEQTHSAEAALHLAATFGIPGQNMMVADKDGHIGWTIAGRLPARGSAESGVSQLSTDPTVGFSGWLVATNNPGCSTRPRASYGPPMPASSADLAPRSSATTGWIEARAPGRSKRISRAPHRPSRLQLALPCSSTTAPCFSSAGACC
jgi:penicillin amidase